MLTLRVTVLLNLFGWQNTAVRANVQKAFEQYGADVKAFNVGVVKGLVPQDPYTKPPWFVPARAAVLLHVVDVFLFVCLFQVQVRAAPASV